MKFKRKKKSFGIYAFIKWVIYFFIICTAFVASTVGTSVKPLMLIPIAVTISAFEEDEFIAAGIAVLCGFMMDVAGAKLFGYNAFMLLGMCIFTALMFKHFLRPSIINVVFFSSLVSFILGALDFLFYYAMWDYEGVAVIFKHITVPCWLYTTISSIPIFIIVMLLKTKLVPKYTQTIEENASVSDD